MTDFPDLLSLTPAKADRAWRKWLADREPFTGDLERAAGFVGKAIEEWRHYFGKPDNEENSRKYLEAKIAAFKAALPAD